MEINNTEQEQEQEFEQLREYRAWDSYNHKMVMNPFQFHTLKNGVNELRTRSLLVRYAKFMQFTGKFDKNGNKIFDGDILCFMAVKGDKGINFSIKYNIETCSYEGFITSYGWSETCEVIGNIYENPNLLKENKS